MDRPLNRKKSPKLKFVILTTGVCAVIVIVICWGLLTSSLPEVDKNALRLGVVAQGEFRVNVVGSGYVVPQDVEVVLPRVAGRVITVNVKSGDRVKEGDVIAKLGNDDLLAQESQRRLLLTESQEALSSQEFVLHSDQMTLQAKVLELESEYNILSESYKLYKELIDKPNAPVSRLEYRQVVIRTEQAKKQYQFGKAQLRNFENSMAARLDQYKARVAVAEKELSRVSFQVANLALTAARSGLIQDLEVRPGELIGEGSVVAKIIDPEKYVVRLQVPAGSAHKISIGQSSTVEINNRSIPGVVSRIDPNVKGTTLDVDIALSQDVPEIRINMHISGEIEVARLNNAMYLEKPFGATENGNSLFYVVYDDGRRAKVKRIQTGLFSSNRVQIVSGLHVGDAVVLSNLGSVNGASEIRID